MTKAAQRGAEGAVGGFRDFLNRLCVTTGRRASPGHALTARTRFMALRRDGLDAVAPLAFGVVEGAVGGARRSSWRRCLVRLERDDLMLVVTLAGPAGVGMVWLRIAAATSSAIWLAACSVSTSRRRAANSSPPTRAITRSCVGGV